MSSRASQGQPNILIVVVDTLRADRASCYGYHRQTTPQIDRLAAEGCLFETAISAAPFSPSSYASLFSNLYPHQHGVNGDTVRVWPNHFTRLAEKLKANGYSTFLASNNDFVSSQCNSVQGFDDCEEGWNLGPFRRRQQRVFGLLRKWLGPDRARRFESNALQCSVKGDSQKTMNAARRFIERAKTPFFGFIVLMDPHTPYDRSRKRFLTGSKDEADFFRRINVANMWARQMASGQPLSPEHLRVVHDSYDSQTHHADECVGQLCDWLRERSQLDNTVLAIAADHGEAFGEQGIWGHGFCLNDCLTRVPLILRCPRYWPAGRRSPALVQLHDLHDLCLSVSADGQPQPHFFARCLTQASDPSWTGRDFAFSEFPLQTGTLSMLRNLNPAYVPGRWETDVWAIRSREWRYLEYGQHSHELYDLVDDPQEKTSVHHLHPDVCSEMAARLQAHRCDQTYQSPTGTSGQGEEVDEVVLERLRGLGYIE